MPKKNKFNFIKRYIGTSIEILPLAVPAGLAAFSVVAIVFLLLGEFRGLYVWPLGLLAAAGAVYAVAKYVPKIDRPVSRRERWVCDLLVIALIIFWVIFNSFFTAQHVFTDRDPAAYANAGAWLIEHDNLHIPESVFFEGISDMASTSGGFETSNHDDGNIYAHGVHLLPALLGLGGKIGGAGFMLHINLLFGGTALLALYGFARLLVRPRWAMVATAAFAVSLPLIFFSRDTYTEPLAATFTFGALALIYVAMQTKKLGLWFIAGLLAGAGTLTRIDAYLTLVALAAFVVIMLAISRRGERTSSLKQAMVFGAGATITAVLGWLDASMLSVPYYDNLFGLFMRMALAIAAILIAGTIGVVLSWKTGLLGWLHKITKSWRVWASVIAVIVMGIGLASQPSWRLDYNDHFNAFVVDLQRKNDIPVQQHYNNDEPVSRSFAEQSVNWTIWYIGLATAILSLVGLAYAAGRTMKDRSLLLLPAIAVIGGTALVYFIKPSITPDQIWASRRFVPVILPGMIILATIAIAKIWELPKRRLLGLDGRIIATVLATLMITSPFAVSQPFLTLREYPAHLNATYDVCKKLPNSAAVVWVGVARTQLVQPTRTFCNVTAAGYGGLFSNKFPNKDTLKQVAQRAKQQNKLPVVGVFGWQAPLLVGEGKQEQLTLVGRYEGQMMEQTLLRPPRVTVPLDRSILLGKINLDGTIEPLPAP